ncbi:uncharacterized protein LOC129593154 [Paramacrobiotus metropolitanus]|uniref:uncharacterized protein LOC129593154 n=1 Tax=Paramacrobiotus metropolitanus TaxID=2943436 RepID=UPI002445E86E|nr:uncharacterized protein LOC129593154 [Paramacrobiotus metropolitanus]
MMDKLANIPRATGGVLALSTAEVLLAIVGFAAHFYNLFYGILADTDDSVPMVQTLVFVVSLPLYGTQVVCGARFMLAGVRLLRGQRNSAFFDDGGTNISVCDLGICQIWALMCCIICLLAMVLAWFCEVSFAANRLISSAKLDVLYSKPGTVARPIPDAWSAVKRAFQANVTGQLVMLAAVLLLIASVIVVVVIMRQSKAVRKELKSADRNADDHKSSKEEHKLLARAKEHNGTPPPSYTA